MKRFAFSISIILFFLITASVFSQNDTKNIIIGDNDVSMHIEGIELHTEIAAYTPGEDDGAFLVLYFQLVNESDRERCVFARNLRVIIDDEEYAPQNWLMDAVKEDLEPERDFTGAFAGQCVSKKSNADSFAAFDVPHISKNFDISFYGNIETFALKDLLLEQPVDDLPVSNSTSKSTEGIIIANQNVNARSCPSKDCSVVDVLAPQEKITVTGIENDWYVIELADGTQGYVFVDLVRLTEDQENSSIEVTTAKNEDDNAKTSDKPDSNLSIRELSDKEQASLVKAGLIIVINDKDVNFTIEDVQIADGRAKGGERGLLISYKSRALDSVELLEELGFIFGGAGGAIREFNMDIDSVSIIIGDALGNAIGIVDVSTPDLLSFINGKITAMEFIGKLNFVSLTE